MELRRLKKTDGGSFEGDVVKGEEEEQKMQASQLILDRKWSLWQLVMVIFPFRLMNALTIRTFFQPDEYYQSIEIAHHLVFGTGYVTWEWKQHLRSAIHPLIYAGGYWVAKMGPLRCQTGLVLALPRIIGAIIATVGELALYRLSLRVSGGRHQVSNRVLVLSLLSPFNAYFITRSFSNGFEMVITTVGLGFWPWGDDGEVRVRQPQNGAGPNHTQNRTQSDRDVLIAAGFGFVSILVRPSNALVWVYPGLQLVWNRRHRRVPLLRLLGKLIMVFIVINGINVGLDYVLYQQITFPFYNFLEFNVMKNLSVFYGTAPWHFYLFQAIPLLLMAYLPTFVISMFSETLAISTPALKTLKIIIGIVVVGFSLISHKEIRFIYPVMPLMLILTGVRFTFTPTRVRTLMLINGVIAIFFTRIHERGVIDVMDYIRRDGSITSIAVLTPCHSTPWQSQLHRPDLDLWSKAWFVTCEPPFSAISHYMDESDVFYDNPQRFIAQRMNLHPKNSALGPELHHEDKPRDPALATETSAPARDPALSEGPYWASSSGSSSSNASSRSGDLPDRIVVFEPLKQLMDSYGEYHVCQRFFNSYFHWDSRRHGDVLVYCLG